MSYDPWEDDPHFAESFTIEGSQKTAILYYDSFAEAPCTWQSEDKGEALLAKVSSSFGGYPQRSASPGQPNLHPEGHFSKEDWIACGEHEEEWEDNRVWAPNYYLPCEWDGRTFSKCSVERATTVILVPQPATELEKLALAGSPYAPEKMAESLFLEWKMYVVGEVYGFTILDENKDEVDACWGIYGREFAEEEAKSALQHWSKQ